MGASADDLRDALAVWACHLLVGSAIGDWPAARMPSTCVAPSSRTSTVRRSPFPEGFVHSRPAERCDIPLPYCRHTIGVEITITVKTNDAAMIAAEWRKRCRRSQRSCNSPASYRARASGLLRIAWASLISLNRSSALSSPALRSGWYRLASLRKAALISASPARRGKPSTPYKVRTKLSPGRMKNRRLIASARQ